MNILKEQKYIKGEQMTVSNHFILSQILIARPGCQIGQAIGTFIYTCHSSLVITQPILVLQFKLYG